MAADWGSKRKETRAGKNDPKNDIQDQSWENLRKCAEVEKFAIAKRLEEGREGAQIYQWTKKLLLENSQENGGCLQK